MARRVRRLEDSGVLRGCTAPLDPRLDGSALQAVVHVRVAVDAAPEATGAGAAVPAVVEVLDLAGTVDDEVRLCCGTQQELYDAVQAVRAAPGVTGIETRPVLRHVLRR